MTQEDGPPTLRAEDLVQHRGGRRVLHQVSFSIDGGVVGLLGPNGAGKTTLLETICTILAPVSGSLNVLGRPVDRRREAQAIRRTIGFLPQQLGYVPSFTARDFVEYVVWSKGVESGRVARAAATALETVGLAAVAARKMRTLSGGMVQRVGIAAAIAHRPGLLVLDEPTAGLDPRQRAEFRNLVRTVGKDTPVILSTHLTDDIAAMCDEVLVLSDGRIAFHGSTRQLAARGDGASVGDTPLERGYSSVVELHVR